MTAPTANCDSNSLILLRTADSPWLYHHYYLQYDGTGAPLGGERFGGSC